MGAPLLFLWTADQPTVGFGSQLILSPSRKILHRSFRRVVESCGKPANQAATGKGCRMSDQRVSMFISHKVATQKGAARRIKQILEGRTDRLDVIICEEIVAGDRWRDWIAQRISQAQIMLVLVPHDRTDLTWIQSEISRFEGVCPTGRLVVLKFQADPIPDTLRERQIIDVSAEQLLEHFLKPLYRGLELTKLDAPLNPRVADFDLKRDALQIEEALLGLSDLRPDRYGESLIVETNGLDVTKDGGLAAALVKAPNGCAQILNWNRRSFRWDEFRARAAEDKGKGTFWVTEMEQVIGEVARQSRPRVMSSTFRGRGHVAGQIFRPQLERVDFCCDETPVRYHFAFHEVLVPELVRGKGPVGGVFNLIYMATRVRWEVLNPFLVNASTNGGAPALPASPDQQSDFIQRVKTSLRIIELEAERHDMINVARDAFEDSERDVVVQLLEKREQIKSAIEAAADRQDFGRLMEQLTHGLLFNCEAMEVLAKRFLQLVQEDRQKVQHRVEKTGPGQVSVQ